MKSLLIGIASGLAIVLMTLGIMDSVSVHRRITRLENNVQNVANFVSQRLNTPQPARVEKAEEGKNKKKKR